MKYYLVIIEEFNGVDWNKMSYSIEAKNPSQAAYKVGKDINKDRKNPTRFHSVKLEK